MIFSMTLCAPCRPFQRAEFSLAHIYVTITQSQGHVVVYAACVRTKTSWHIREERKNRAFRSGSYPILHGDGARSYNKRKGYAVGPVIYSELSRHKGRIVTPARDLCCSGETTLHDARVDHHLSPAFTQRSTHASKQLGLRVFTSTLPCTYEV